MVRGVTKRVEGGGRGQGVEGEGCGRGAWPRGCRVRGVAKGSGGCNVVHVHLCTHLCVPRGGYSV